MSVPAFIDLPPADQAKELREYLRSLDADIQAESKEDLYEDVSDIIKATESLWKSTEDRDIEGIINSILSLLFVIHANCAPLIKLLCEQLLKAAESGRAQLSMRLLHNFFHGYDIKTPFLYDTYCAWLKVSAMYGNIDIVPTDIKKINAWMDMWNCTSEQTRDLLRLLYDAQIKCGKNSDAAVTMINLLGDYTEDNASQARDDAHRCIARALEDGDTYLYDHLLALKPVMFLEGETIYDLLTIFSCGKLQDYQKFYSENAGFLEQIGLDHDSCTRKMRLLTLIDAVSGHTEVTFGDIQSQLQLGEDDLEEFIIHAIQSKLITGKIDHLNRKLVVSHTTPRTFGRRQWNMLAERLLEWRNKLSNAHARLSTIDPVS